MTREIIVDNVTYQYVCNYVDRILAERVNGKPHFIFAQNPLKVAMASKQPSLLHALESADILIPDGIGITIAARLIGQVRLGERVTGVNLIRELVALADRKGYKVFFLGARPGVAEQAVNNLKAEYPQLRIAGTADGYFRREDEEAIVSMINSTHPDILFVCMGSPIQELFLQRNRSVIHVPICAGGGGSLDVYSEKVKRSPLIFQRLGIEWLYRLFKEPRRAKRIICGISRYLLLVVRACEHRVGQRKFS